MKKTFFILFMLSYGYVSAESNALVNQFLSNSIKMSAAQAQESLQTLIQSMTDEQEKINFLESLKQGLKEKISYLQNDGNTIDYSYGTITKSIIAGFGIMASCIASCYFSSQDRIVVYKEQPHYQALENFACELITPQDSELLSHYSAVTYFVNSEHKIRITHPEISNLTSNDDENNLQKLTKLLKNACLERPGLGEKIIAPRDYFNNTCSQVCIAIAGVLSAYLTYQLFVNYKNLNQQANAQMQCNVYQKLLDYVIQLQAK